MGLESATYIDDLNTANPVGATDPKSQGDDHIRLLKTVLKNTFPNIDGAVNPTPTELNLLVGMLGVKGTVSVSSTPYTVLAASQNKMHLVDATSAAITANLPAVADVFPGWRTAFCKIDSSANAVTLDGDTTEDLNGSLTYLLRKQYQIVWLCATATGWIVERSYGVQGPTGASVDNALARWDGTTGELIQSSGTTLDDNNVLTLGGPIIKKTSSDVASASSVDLSALTGNLADLTGSTTITEFAGYATGEFWLRCTGAPLLTYNASTLLLPGAVDFQCAAGDMLRVQFIDTDSVYVTPFKADGTPVVSAGAGGLTLLGSATPNGSAQYATFSGLDVSGYSKLILEVEGAYGNTASTALQIQFGYGGTPTWVTSLYYEHGGYGRTSDGTWQPIDLNNAGGIRMHAGNISSSNTGSVSAIVELMNLAAGADLTGQDKTFFGRWDQHDNSTTHQWGVSGGHNTTSALRQADITAIRCGVSSGLFTARAVRLIGVAYA